MGQCRLAVASSTDQAGGKRRLFIARLGQGQLAPELLQMRGHDCPSEGLRPLWRVEPDLKRDPDCRQHATQHNDLERRHCFVKSRPPDFLVAYQDNQRILALGKDARGL